MRSFDLLGHTMRQYNEQMTCLEYKILRKRDQETEKGSRPGTNCTGVDQSDRDLIGGFRIIHQRASQVTQSYSYGIAK